MQGRYAIHAPLLIKTLLRHFTEQKKAPPGLYGNSGGNSIVLGIAGRYCYFSTSKNISNIICFMVAELWSIITFNKKTDGSDEDSINNAKIEAPLANQALLLILVLTNHCTTQINPYRQSLFCCSNSQGNVYFSEDKT